MPRVEFDPAKDAANKIKHGLSFADFRGFDSPPQLVVDVRNNYGEHRFRAFGRIEGVPHSMAFTMRNGALRLISFRRAHEKELARYAK